MPGIFETRLHEGPPLVADGGMGVVLSAAVPGLRCPEEANLRAPDAVTSVHVSFINAGAELIETNTFGANRRKLAQHFLEDDFERINSTAVKLAREAREISGREVLIGASIGPLGDVELRPEDDGELFAEQAKLLEGRGADLFMLETFYDLHELEVAVEAVRSVSQLPIVALMSFDSDGVTLAGVAAADAGARLRELPVQAFGANHGRGPAAALTALAEMAGDGAALAALPNVGLASMAGARVSFPLATPEYFADFAATARSLGARVIGGCCGTTPAQIAAIRTALDENRPAAGPLACAGAGARSSRRAGRGADRAGAAPGRGGVRRLGAARPAARRQRRRPRRGGPDPEGVGPCALRRRERQPAGTRADERDDGVSRDPARGRDRGDPPSDPARLDDRGPRVAPARLTRRGHSQRARRHGRPAGGGRLPGTGAVYDVDAIGLVELISRLNDGTDFHRRAIDAPTSFFPGVAVNPTADDLDLEVERFHRKIEAGAQFAMTQILFDMTYLDAFLERFGGPSPIPLLVGVWPIKSLELAVRVHNETPGIVVPDHVQERYRAAGSNAAEVGAELAHELIARAREVAAGVYIVAPFRRPLGVLEILPG